MMAATSLSPTLASLSPSSSSSTSTSRKHASISSISSVSLPQPNKFLFFKLNSHLGRFEFSSWNGLRHLGVPTSRFTVKIGLDRKCKRKGVYASLFGVGAPEALVIGVVALLVFGPKGLAEVARNIGKTMRAFQPTIRELQEVSRDFKSTLEREIGLDEIQETTRPTGAPPSTAVSDDFPKTTNSTDGSSPSSEAYTTEEYLKITDEQLKRQKEMETSESEVEAQGQSEAVGSPSSTEAFPTEEYARNSNEQVEASAILKPQTTVSTESQVEPQSLKQDLSNEETQEYLKKLEEKVNAGIAEKQKRLASEAACQDNQEAASETPLPQNPENES